MQLRLRVNDVMFLWNFQTDGRLPPRGAWHWEHDCGHFFRVILRVEIVAEGPKAGLLDTISVVQIEWLGWALNGLQEYAYAHLEGLFGTGKAARTS
jgi:hypothetical protein